MSMKPQPIPEIPAETVRVVRAVFPKGNLYIHLRDTLGTIYQDELFTDLYPVETGAGHGLPIHGEFDGSTSRRCGTQSIRLEILLEPGID